MADWLEKFDETMRDRFPLNTHFHITHAASQCRMSVDNGERFDKAGLVGIAAGNPFFDSYPFVGEWRFEAVTSEKDPFHITHDEIPYPGPARRDGKKTWSRVSFGPVMIINRYSGLPVCLQGAENQAIQRLDPELTGYVVEKTGLFHVTGWDREEGKFYIEARPRNGRAVYLQIEHDQPGGPVLPVKSIPRDKVGPAQLPRCHWALTRVAAAETSARHPAEVPLDLGGETADGYAYAQEALGMLASMGRTIGIIGATVGASETAIVGFAVGGVAQFIGHILNFVKISEGQELDDPIQVLYETLVPEVRDIMESELVRDNVTDAEARARMASGTWKQAMRGIAHFVHQYEKKHDLAPEGETVLQQMEAHERERAVTLLSQADEHFSMAAATLMIPQNAEAGLPALLPLAAEHAAVILVLGQLYPGLDGLNVPSRIREYHDHIDATWTRMKTRREARVTPDLRDTFLPGAPYMADLDVARFNAARTLDLDLGQPSVAIRSLGNILDVWKTSTS